jgi:GDP-mannose transporter
MKYHHCYILLVSTSYLLISLSTTILNKYILTVLNFNTPFLLVVLQSCIICCILLISRLINFCNLDISNFKKWMIPSFFLCIMIFSGSKSLKYLDISFYTLLKNINIILIAVTELVFYNRRFNKKEFLSYILMIISSFYNFTYSNIYGLVWISLNMLSTTVYVISLRHIISINKGSVSESIFFPNMLSIIFIGIVSYTFEYNNTKEYTWYLLLCIGMSSVCALLTALTTAYVLNYLSSTTYSMLGAINKIILGFTGFIFIGEEICKLKIFSLFLGVSSTILYTVNLNRTNKKL